MDEEQGFEVVDKRGSVDEAVAEEEPTAKAAQESEPEAVEPEAEPAAPEHAGEEEPPGVPAADAYSIAAFTIELLAAAAWRTMGMQIDPGTGKIEKDLEQARFSIDCISALYDKMHPKLDETARRDVRALISNLQINFVNQSK